MEKNIPLELERNSVNILEYRFERLLLGIDTEKEKFTSPSQKRVIIKAIKSYVYYRIKEKILLPDSEIWKLVLEINKLDFNSLEKIKEIYSKLYNLKHPYSPQKYSNYYKQKGREETQKDGVRSFGQFLKLIGKNKKRKKMKDTNNKILAIIYSDKEKFLLLKTNPKTMKLDEWYVVTGAVKEGENFKEAVIRETKEETRLEIVNIKPTEIVYDYEWPPNSNIVKHEQVFVVKVKYSEPKITKWEHLDWKWVNKNDFIKEVYWYGESKDKLKELLKNET